MLDFGSISLISLSSAMFGAGGFYLLTNWRLTKLEDSSKKMVEIRERLIRIETILNERDKG